jgi:hypothetical protein
MLANTVLVRTRSPGCALPFLGEGEGYGGIFLKQRHTATWNAVFLYLLKLIIIGAGNASDYPPAGV